MATLLIALLSGLGFLVAYHTYGRWLGSRIFRLSADAACPAHRLSDGSDYVPTAKAVVFGHHFTSIAGTGPIVGPAIAVMWGWLPALLWVVFGSIFIGAVHDLGALVVSLRNNGQTVGDIAGRVLNPRVRLLFLLVLFMALTIVLAIFGLVIAAVFRIYPAAIFPCLVQIPIAAGIGLWLHRKGVGLTLPSVLALGLMYLTVVFGNQSTAVAQLLPGVLGSAVGAIEGGLHAFNTYMAGLPTIVWVVLLLGYSYVASVIPVWVLLQPRDYINSLQLISALGLVVVGLFVAGLFGGAPLGEQAARPALEIAAPMVNLHPEGAPPMLPFLFITIACGAISGFHCLVSSGTSSKQLDREPDAYFVGYGSMLTEGFLAVIVILACVAGLGLGVVGQDGGLLVGEAAYAARYANWAAAGSLGAKVGAFVDGSANFLKAIGVPVGVAVALMGVLVASFAATTLDTACRLQRYVVQELASTFAPRVSHTADAAVGYDDQHEHHPHAPGQPTGGAALNPLTWLTNKHGATIFAVLLGVAMAAVPINGQWTLEFMGTGGLILWPMFGATNQLLGGLAFLVISFYLWRRGVPVWFMVLPMVVMLIMPAWAMISEVPGWVREEQWLLVVIAVATLVFEAWMIVEAALLWPKVRNVLEPRLPGNDDPLTAAPAEPRPKAAATV